MIKASTEFSRSWYSWYSSWQEWEPLRRKSSGMSVFPGTMWKMESSIRSVLGYQAKRKAKASWAQVFSSFIFLKTDDKWPSASNSRFHAFHTVAKWPLKLWMKKKTKTKHSLLIIFLDALSQNKKLTNPILFLFFKQWYEISWCLFESFLITVYFLNTLIWDL